MTDIKTTLPSKDPRVTMEHLRERQEQHAEQLAVLATERGKLALAAAEGDMGALEKLRALDAEERTLHASNINIEAALAHASELLKPILAAENEKRRVAARAKTEEELARYAAFCSRCDEAISTAGKLLAERAALAARLGEHRFIVHDELWRQVGQELAHRAQSTGAVQHSLATAGFGRYLTMLQGPPPGDPQNLYEHALTLRLPPEHLCADPSP
jgi:hypothetical protein